MVKTRRSNGENGEIGDIDEGTLTLNDVGSVSDEKASNWSQRELRSSQQFKVKRKTWPATYSRRRRRSLKMPRIVFPESDTEPEKYSRRSRQVRVFFAEDNETPNRSIAIRRGRTTRKNYIEDSEDKPIQQNVRRSCRKRKLLHHNFNESWITNELKVKGYPDLYGFQGSSSSDEFSSGDERRVKKLTANPPTITDEDTQMSRTRRTSARFSNKKINASDSDSEADKNQTVIEKKQTNGTDKHEDSTMEVEIAEKNNESSTEENAEQRQESESNQAPARSTRGRSRRTQKKEDSQQDSGSESSSSSGSEITLTRQPRRSKRKRQPRQAFVEIAPGTTRTRATTFKIRQPYSLRERKPKILRRKNIRANSPSSTSSSGSDTEDLNVSVKNKTKGRQKTKSMDEKTDKALREIQPVELDGSVRFTSVGGLDEHIKCLREMVLFPLMYPDLFKKFNTRPAKGVLFHGPPGTGKTLLARALANECSLVGGRKVAFFMRKGADCLKKWVGESERNIKLLFQQANKMKPSIIFFDEIDALAPVRNARQDQVHTSVVGTLLAEMDGLTDRGEVVIIGATNRLDAVDPALRRAGRFDRELHFPPPHAVARKEILQIYTKDWRPWLSNDTLEHMAQVTSGYGGSDLKALCSEAVLKALRRVYPQVYDSEQALLIDAKNVEIRQEDMEAAMRSLVAAGSRASPPSAKHLPTAAEPLLKPQLDAALHMLKTLSPSNKHPDGPLSTNALLITGECSETYIAPAVLAQLEEYSVKELNMTTLHALHAFTQEQALISLFSECRRCDRGCILFIRDIYSVWNSLASSAGGPLLLQMLRTKSAGPNTLIIATANVDRDELPSELQEIFPTYKNCVYVVREPNATEVMSFLKPILTEIPLIPPVIKHTEPPPPLPLAPPPQPPRESEEDIARRKRKEDYKLRELRIFLRDICRKLASNRRFYKFTKPVDLEEVTDYLEIIKQPMDLETMMTKVDMHQYNCAKEFLDDIDLICANALEYNPDRTSSDKQIRHEACSLRDHAHALIDVEMDSDFELECQSIAKRRQDAGNAADADLPDFIYTASNLTVVNASSNQSESKTPRVTQNGDKIETHSAKRKRRRINAWSKGMVVKRQRSSKSFKDPHAEDKIEITDDDSKENKPITSTPMTNGMSSSCSDDDAPLKRPREESEIFNLSSQTVVNHYLESPTKSTERAPSTKSSPKKRNSGHETSGDGEKVLINKTELDNLLYKNAKQLRCIGLEALLDLYSQLSAVAQTYSDKYDRTKLPSELHEIVARYVQLAKK